MASLATVHPSASRLITVPLVPTLLVLFAVLAVAAALIYVFVTAGPARTGASETIYQTAPVRRGSVSGTINAPGQITTPASVPLLSSMPATVSIITQRADNVLLVPNTAFSFASGGAQSAQPAAGSSAERSLVVMVLGDGRPTARQVRPGVSDDLHTQIVSGLESGEEVIVGQVVTGQGQPRTQGK